MTNTKANIRHCRTRGEALQRMRMLNQGTRKAGDMGSIFVVVRGPDEGWSVVDLATAIDLGIGCEWEAA